ncbi:unnamed protein product [Parnassius mnemosyne]|uniref:Uncharacterized protein n=1 Tax=Parnassius mnemosyne TaxID=213953 RepID=A0AAV1KRF7_9NEOP
MDFATESKVRKDLLIYHINTRPICEVVILTVTIQQIPEVCDVTTFFAHINTFQALRNNKWIYILQRKTPYSLECESKTTHGKISEAGIITLEQGCKMYTAFVTLLAEDTKSINISHPFIYVDIEHICVPYEIKLQQPELAPIQLNNLQLDSLNSVRQQIKTHIKLLEHNKPTFLEKHVTKFSILCTITG